MTAPKPLLSLLPDLPDLFAGSPFTTWTDEQWRAHDARVAAEKASDEASDFAARSKSRCSEFIAAGFPLRALERAEHCDETAKAITRVKTWDTDKENVLVLAGPPGCGKTVAAAWWSLRRARPPVFLRSTAFAANSRFDAAKRDEWLKAGALVLDDLGTEYADTKGNYLVDLDELIDTFYGDRRPLLITTNCDDTTFKTRYGARIVDRVRECGAFAWIAGASMRSKGA